MSIPPVEPNFERALAAEIMASERMRVRVLAAVLVILFAIQQAIGQARAEGRLASPDLAHIKVASVIAAWARVSLGGWFTAVAGHQERHLDQARRACAAVGGQGR